jgi:hypothetical protein
MYWSGSWPVWRSVRTVDLFVLKGGMLLAVWDARRATVDGDFLARNLGVDEPTVLARVVEVASTQPPVEDGVEYRVNTASASTIRDGDLYGGVRVSMDATVAGARVKLRLDVSTGDPVIPPPNVISYPTLRPHHPALRILGYPLVVVLAEKPCTAVELGAGNSRLRDDADVWTLTGLHDINGNELAGAREVTAAHRGVELRPLLRLIGDYGTARASGYAAYLRRLGPDATLCRRPRDDQHEPRPGRPRPPDDLRPQPLGHREYDPLGEGRYFP